MNIFKLTVIVVFMFFLFAGTAISQQTGKLDTPKKLPPLTGEIQENAYETRSTDKPTGFVKDSLSGNPINGAQVSIPDKNISTYSRADGSFKLDTRGEDGNFILSIKKQGYLPFALSVKKEDLSTPFTLHVQKDRGELVVDSRLHHLGDNKFSTMSANATAFKQPSEGPVFTKQFYIEALPPKGMVLRIGSIIGLDTIASREVGQSKIDTFSSPLSIYVNSVKVAEIGINANNKLIPIPRPVLKAHSQNLLVFQTGVNQLYQMMGGFDYDDIEFMNIFLEEVK